MTSLHDDLNVEVGQQNNADMAKRSTMTAVIVAKKEATYFVVIGVLRHFICFAMTHHSRKMTCHLGSGYAIDVELPLLREKMTMLKAPPVVAPSVQT